MKAHPGFKSVQSSIAKKQGISKDRAGAILGAASRHASAAAKHANPRLNRVKGKMHSGGMIPEDGLYEMKKDEMVIPADTKGDYHFVSHTKNLDVAHVMETKGFPSDSPEADGVGHWEVDGNDAKFIKG
jgi:hypothetical protein